MSERFRFDQRVLPVPKPPLGKEVVKCFGMPVVVCAAKPGERVLGSGLTESQAREVGQLVLDQGVDRLALQKQMVAQGQLK